MRRTVYSSCEGRAVEQRQRESVVNGRLFREFVEVKIEAADDILDLGTHRARLVEDDID